MTVNDNAKGDPASGEPPRGGGKRSIVVGIGASAGGLRALKELLPTVPRESGLSFVVVVHLAADHESHLADLLQPHSQIPVSQVTEETPIEPNRVYVIPPGRNLSAVDSHLRLAPLDEARARRAPVNHFFQTLAETHDGSAVGVILSGTGTDGAEGIRYIREGGGLTIVQDPDEAEFDGMPRSAIAMGLVDRVLPVRTIVGQILEFSATHPQIPAAHVAGDAAQETGSDELHTLMTVVRVRTGHDFLRYKRSTAERRISRRMQLLNLERVADYLEVLRADDKEVAALVDDLLINVTSFFRDPQVFQALEKLIVPDLFERKSRDDSVRVWSVGCATGEEPYSIGMLLLEEASRRPNPPGVHVFATDLHERSLQMGREALFGDTIEGEVSPERLERFFRREGTGYRVVKPLRDAVVFAAHNVLRDPPFSRLDLIVCRNLLIYLQHEVQNEVIDIFHYALRSGGRLVLGTAETLDRSELFRVENKEAHIYRRRDVARGAVRIPSFPLASSSARKQTVVAESLAVPRHLETGFGAAHERMVLRHAPPSLLVAPDHEIVYLSPGVGRYLEYQSGEPSSDLLKIVREEFRMELRTALHLVRERRIPWQSRPIPTKLNGEAWAVILHVSPAEDPEFEGFALITFTEVNGLLQTRSGQPVDEDARSRDLESELGASQTRMQALIEEFESSQEEMQAANEELQSANEELRSTLEELETSREELQSVNEELQTLNQENRHKVEELSQLSSDLQNLLQATDVATLFLDRNLRILRYTPRVAEVFSVRYTDRGRPLADLTHRLGHPNLIDEARHVLQTLVPTEVEVQARDADAHYLLRIAPYRTVDDRIEGLVLTIIDVTALKQTQAALRQSEERQRFLVQLQDATSLLTDPFAVHETATRMLAQHLAVNAVAYLEIHGNEAVVTGSYAHEVPPLPNRIKLSDFGSHVESAFSGGETIVIEDVRTDSRFTDAERDWYRAADIVAVTGSVLIKAGRAFAALLIHSRVPRHWSAGDQALISNVFGRTWETSERARIEASLRAAQERFRLIVEAARDYAIVSLDAKGTIVSWSAGATAIFGWRPEEAIGQSADLTFTREDREAGKPTAELAEARTQGQAPDNRWHVRKDGSRVFIEGSTRTLTGVGGQIAFLKVGQDVTARLALEEALRELNQKLEDRVAERTRQLTSTGQALRESDARYRLLFESIDQGFCVIEVIFDDRLRSVDYRFVEVNPAFERLTGIAAAAGRSVRALIPDHEPYWFEIFGRIALTGQPERFERPAESLGGWYDMYAFRVGDPAERRVAVLFSDILDRKRAEAERDTLRARLVQAEDDERRRLARELHDEASQRLTSLGLGLKALSDVAPPGSEIDQRADELRALVDSLGKELHAVAVRLRPRALDDFGLEAALRSYVEDWARQSGVAVDVHTAQDSTRLPGLVESTIYRIVQEALTNVLRHAAATHVSVVLERHDGQVVVVVEDDGKGFDIADIVDNPTLPGLGLRGIRERAALLRGTAEIESHVGGGTSIYARIPIAELGSSMDLPSRRNPSRVRGDG